MDSLTLFKYCIGHCWDMNVKRLMANITRCFVSTVYAELKAAQSSVRARSSTQTPNPTSPCLLRLIVQHFPIINRLCSVPFIFSAIYLPPLPVLCVLCLYRRERTTQADLSKQRQPPDHQWLPADSRPYTSTASGPSSAQ